MFQNTRYPKILSEILSEMSKIYPKNSFYLNEKLIDAEHL